MLCGVLERAVRHPPLQLHPREAFLHGAEKGLSILAHEANARAVALVDTCALDHPCLPARILRQPRKGVEEHIDDLLAARAEIF